MKKVWFYFSYTKDLSVSNETKQSQMRFSRYVCSPWYIFKRVIENL